MNKIVDIDTVTFDNWRETLMLYKFALEEVETKVNILNEEFLIKKEYNPIEHIKTRIKKPERILDKLNRKGHEAILENAARYIEDIAGLRIICSFKEDIFTVADMLEKQDDMEIVRVSDYVTNPKPNGYQSYHMIVKVPVFLSNVTEKVKVEIQIRTSAMDFWASLEHKINYKYNYKAPQELIERLKECAEISSSLDEKMYRIKEDIDNIKSIYHDNGETGDIID